MVGELGAGRLRAGSWRVGMLAGLVVLAGCTPKRSNAAVEAEPLPFLPPAAGAEAPPQVLASEPVVNLGEATQAITPENFLLGMNVVGLLPAAKGRADLSVSLEREAGEWQPGTAGAPQYNRGAHEVDGRHLKFEDGRMTGRLKIVIRPDDKVPPDGKPRQVECAIDAQVVRLEGRLPGDIAIEAAQFRKDFATAPPASLGLEGTYQATFEGEVVRGRVGGQFSLPARPGFWNRGVYEEGLKLDLDMGTKRVNWNHGRWAVYPFGKPRDLSRFSGLRLRIATGRPRADVSAGVWLREEDGSWYYVKSAVPLVDAANEAVILFEDFTEAEWIAPGNHMDEDYVLDLKRISHLAVGVVNSLGVGQVPFTVTGLDLVECRREPPPPVQVRVTGKTLAVNGHEMVPPGLFGGYAPAVPQEFRPGCQRHLGGADGPRIPAEGETEAYLIDCWFDRYCSAIVLHRPDWKEWLENAARNYARKAKEANYQAHLEFWNEPYLNWAKPPGGRNYNVKFYDVEKAVDGGPVTIKSTGEKFPLFRWKKTGDGWQVVDPSQFTYWSGLGSGELYDRMCEAVARAVKKTNPDVRVIAGWGFRWNEDHWAAWHMLYKPTIDRCIKYIDAIGEHHYQGDTTAMNGTYEVLTAYSMTRYGKWLYSYNTETNDLVDAPARGAVNTPEKARRATHYRRMVYNLRDIIYCVLQSPDKFLARTVLHPVRGGEVMSWTRAAYGLLKNLRGRLVETAGADPQVWCVASVDGTDPQAMPPDPGKTLVVIVFNDHRAARRVELSVTSPTGTTFRDGRIEWTRFNKGDYRISVGDKTAKASGKGASFTFTLPERSAWKVSLPLEGDLAEGAEVERRQFFAKAILREVLRDRPFRCKVGLDRGALRTARRAWLRCVVEDVAPGEGSVTVGDRTFRLPKAYTADNVTRIVEVPLDPADLSKTTDIEFRVNPGNFAGYRVDMVSIVLEQRRAGSLSSSSVPSSRRGALKTCEGPEYGKSQVIPDD